MMRINKGAYSRWHLGSINIGITFAHHKLLIGGRERAKYSLLNYNCLTQNIAQSQSIHETIAPSNIPPSSKMTTLETLHHEAMELVDRALLARQNGNHDQATQLIRSAFDREKTAARLTADQLDLEPTRSVLHRSAATLALECNELREAERLISRALSGFPPIAIAEELRNLLIEEIYSHREQISA
jgi:hypothetical protein